MAIRQLKIGRSITTRDAGSSIKYLQELNRIPLLTAEQETKLCERIKEGDAQATEALVRANLRFVVSIAKQYEGHGLALSDLINEGNIGLLRAVKRYDPSRGFKFISFAVWWIRQHIMIAISEQARMIRLPQNRITERMKVQRAFGQLEQELGHIPSTEQIAKHTGLSEEHFEAAQQARDHLISLDAPQTKDDGDEIFGDTIAHPEAQQEIEAFERQQSLKIEILRLLNILSARERQIICAVFGVGGSPLLPAEGIAQRYGISSERVRQLKEKALKRLRHSKGTPLLKSLL